MKRRILGLGLVLLLTGPALAVHVNTTPMPEPDLDAAVHSAAGRDDAIMRTPSTLGAPNFGLSKKEIAARALSLQKPSSTAGLKGDTAMALKLAHHMDEIAASYRHDADFELWRMLAWSNVAMAYKNSSDPQRPERARDTAREMDAIAAPFTSSYDFELLRAAAWTDVAGAFAECGGEDTGVNAKHAARIVDAISAHFEKPPYDTSRVFRMNRGAAWLSVALAYATTADVEDTKEAADTVNRIIDSMDNPVGLETLKPMSQAAIALAYANRGDIDNAYTAALRLDKLAAPFTNAYMVEFERARAWAGVAAALARKGNSEGAHNAAHYVSEIATKFEDKPSSKQFQDLAERAERYADNGDRLQ